MNEELGATINDDFLIHPNEFTVEEREGGPWSQPFSLGCQIMYLKSFNEMTGILKGLGFKYKGRLAQRDPEQRGEAITVMTTTILR